MKRYTATVLAIISLSAWGADTGHTSQKPSVSSEQDNDKKKAITSFSSAGPRSTKIVKAEGEQKGGVDGFLNGGPRSTKIVKPQGDQKKGLEGYLNGGPRSTKIVKPYEAKR